MTACEWSQKAGPYLPAADLTLSLTVDNLARKAELKAFSPLGRAVFSEVTA